eukprot:GHVU01186634.1.p1 GENE.GHVU01186634.1~~GHVU01186634.1.p1  ORF type:complete len:185 (-),score=2.13 GHVU01186634.1:97-651(-)
MQFQRFHDNQPHLATGTERKRREKERDGRSKADGQTQTYYLLLLACTPFLLLPAVAYLLTSWLAGLPMHRPISESPRVEASIRELHSAFPDGFHLRRVQLPLVHRTVRRNFAEWTDGPPVNEVALVTHVLGRRQRSMTRQCASPRVPIVNARQEFHTILCFLRLYRDRWTEGDRSTNKEINRHI